MKVIQQSFSFSISRRALAVFKHSDDLLDSGDLAGSGRVAWLAPGGPAVGAGLQQVAPNFCESNNRNLYFYTEFYNFSQLDILVFWDPCFSGVSSIRRSLIFKAITIQLMDEFQDITMV